MASRTPFFIAALLNAAVAVLVAIGLLLPSPAASPAAGPSASTTTAEPAQESPASEHSDEATPAPHIAPDIAEALAALGSLKVKGRAPMTGYDRALFGQAWSDDVRVPGGRNGCDTRNDVLRRDLHDTVIRPGTHGCLVESGTLLDPYSGETLEFVRGPRSAEIQIDHVVALADAWQKGAQAWDEDTRRDFANDPANLLAVRGDLNQQKGAGDAATWLPPDTSFRCDYVSRCSEPSTRRSSSPGSRGTSPT